VGCKVGFLPPSEARQKFAQSSASRKDIFRGSGKQKKGLTWRELKMWMVEGVKRLVRVLRARDVSFRAKRGVRHANWSLTSLWGGEKVTF